MSSQGSGRSLVLREMGGQRWCDDSHGVLHLRLLRHGWHHDLVFLQHLRHNWRHRVQTLFMPQHHQHHWRHQHRWRHHRPCHFCHGCAVCGPYFWLHVSFGFLRAGPPGRAFWAHHHAPMWSWARFQLRQRYASPCDFPWVTSRTVLLRGKKIRSVFVLFPHSCPAQNKHNKVCQAGDLRWRKANWCLQGMSRNRWVDSSMSTFVPYTGCNKATSSNI